MSSSTDAPMVLEVASAATPAAWAQALTLQGGAAARSAAATAASGDGVAEPQAGEPPVLGHRVQDDEIAEAASDSRSHWGSGSRSQ